MCVHALYKVPYYIPITHIIMTLITLFVAEIWHKSLSMHLHVLYMYVGQF
jgi:hypothetical protein